MSIIITPNAERPVSITKADFADFQAKFAVLVKIFSIIVILC